MPPLLLLVLGWWTQKKGERQIHIPAGQSFVVAVMRKPWLNWHFHCACKDAAQRLLEDVAAVEMMFSQQAENAELREAQALQAERAAMASEYHAQAEERQAEMTRTPI